MPAKKPTRKAPKSFSLKYLVVAVVALGLGALVWYSYSQYKESGIETEGVIVCGKDGVCEKALHIHSALVVSICGKAQDLSKDTGQLADIHTHKQSSVLHFHERLKVTPEGEVLDWTPLRLSNAVEAITGMKLTDRCIGDSCNGDRCPSGQRGSLSLTTAPGFCSGDSCPGVEEAGKAAREEGVAQENIADYVWSDAELLYLTFD